MSKRVLTLAVAAVVVMGLAACRPVFPEGSQLSTEAAGSVLLLDWEEPTVANAEEPIGEYVVFVDGAEVSRVDGIFLGCQLFGLQDDTTYTLGVQAIDEAGRKSDLLTTEVLTDFTEQPDGEVFCSTVPPDM